MPSDRVTEAAGELYAADPGEFTQRRQELAAAARDAGDKDAAKRITALRKPTRAAWAVNLLARADPSVPGHLETLAAGLRAAAAAKDGRRLRELSALRSELIDALTSQALATAAITDPPAGLREDIAATLTSALADPDIARQFATGTLTRAAQWSGFGLAPAADPADGDGPDAVSPAVAESAVTQSAAAEPSVARPAVAQSDVARSAAAATSANVATRGAAVPATAAKPAVADPTVADPTVAAPARSAPPPRTPPSPRTDETADHRRKAFDDAQRSVATAAKAATAAVSVENRLEATVRDLEERLTKARADLADARLRARRAEAAERKARQTLDRLPRP